MPLKTFFLSEYKHVFKCFKNDSSCLTTHHGNMRHPNDNNRIVIVARTDLHFSVSVVISSVTLLRIQADSIFILKFFVGSPLWFIERMHLKARKWDNQSVKKNQEALSKHLKEQFEANDLLFWVLTFIYNKNLIEGGYTRKMILWRLSFDQEILFRWSYAFEVYT